MSGSGKRMSVPIERAAVLKTSEVEGYTYSQSGYGEHEGPKWGETSWKNQHVRVITEYHSRASRWRSAPGSCIWSPSFLPCWMERLRWWVLLPWNKFPLYSNSPEVWNRGIHRSGWILQALIVSHSKSTKMVDECCGNYSVCVIQ